MTRLDETLRIIRDKSNNFSPQIGIVLGSGLDAFAEMLTSPITIDYADLPGFPKPTVLGHAGKLTLGVLHGTRIACLQGRSHLYERPNTSYEEVKTYVRMLKLLGAEYFLATNASGSLREDFCPGDLILTRDHINFQPGNPLAGPNDEALGTRFPPMDEAYHPGFNAHIKKCAQTLGITLKEGVHIAVLGPSYETAAEIRAFQRLGADTISMSTVPEVIVAQHCGLKTAVIAIITNYATGLNTLSHSHEAVVAHARAAVGQLKSLFSEIAKTLPKI